MCLREDNAKKPKKFSERISIYGPQKRAAKLYPLVIASKPRNKITLQKVIAWSSMDNN
jgi:hypothetical protein